MNLMSWWTATRLEAQQHGIAPEEVDFLVRQVTQLSRFDLWQGHTPTTAQAHRLQELWQARLTTPMPMQYLVGEVPWRDFILHIQPGVLIPRPETELLVDWVTATLATVSAPWVVDVGTGSGCIAVGLARTLPPAQLIALDVSPLACAVARHNAQRLGVADRVLVKESFWLEAIHEPLDALVSNPPYIPQAMLATLDPLVQQEPQLALDGGEDGLDAFRVLVQEGLRVLKPGGLWAVEVMQHQAPSVLLLLEEAGYVQTATKPDLEGNARFVLAHRPG